MKIEELAEEKRKKIRDALIKEYAQKGYAGASTNTIVKEAGISKGSLFNYIGNKEAQYFYLISYILDFFKDRLQTYMESAQVPEDYFDKLLFRSNMKIRMSLEYPLEYKLMFDAYMEEAPEVKAFMAEKYQAFAALSMQSGKDRLDEKVLKDPEDRDKLVELVHHLIAGYSANFLSKRSKLTEGELADVLEHMTEELNGYFCLLRKQFFK
ncbi:TetR/AcrR family transcriptional regulator [Acidaminobacter sp. JC074]|uniref:TetR/AcrR family transcriptional regulator n=1 Tax=Acidaminobacter sp. JC074 TaxID=2530199 RepID=UPI001F0EB523|nr:TetR/AcrR family transcriptional regulator [Acidaminobacter sp. JC074]MCH4887723.1 TetR/AcrR family transcriptional regulator [Acidaminobacter sp. JC074]